MCDEKPRLKKAEWVVRDVAIDVARRLVTAEHYARGASNTATYLHGLFHEGDIFDEQCVGVAWWIPPTKSSALATYPARWQAVLALSRLAIRQEAPRNAATFLLSKSRRMIDRSLWPCLVTYADQRLGHTGAIYRADNWTYIGQTKPERSYAINGRMTSRKAGQKTRTHQEMLDMGAELLGSFPKHKFVNIRPF